MKELKVMVADTSGAEVASGESYADRSSSSTTSPTEPVSPSSSSSVATEDSATELCLWSRLFRQNLRNPRSPTVAGWEAVYWRHQEAACQAYDTAACALKVVLLLANVRRSLDHGMIGAARCAGAAAVLAALSLALMLLCQVQYTRYRRLVLWSNLVAISFMMANSIPQFLSATSSRLWGHQFLVLLFKMGVTWPMMAALMHRLPWQDIAALCCTFCTWLCLAWSHPLCNHVAGSAEDAAFVTQLAGVLDTLTGLGMSTGVGHVGYGSSSGDGGGCGSSSGDGGCDSSGSSMQPAGVGPLAQGLATAGSSDSWAPMAQHITAACLSSIPSSLNTTTSSSSSGTVFASSIASSSSSVLSPSDCQSLLFGQCMALVNTLTLWAGVCVILLCVVLAEEHSQWRWWHSSGARRLGASPPKYAPSTTWNFLCSRLLYLHILLDLPLMALWAGFTSWYRQPPKALGDFNLW